MVSDKSYAKTLASINILVEFCPLLENFREQFLPALHEGCEETVKLYASACR